MKIEIPIRALSLNKASKGRHFKTPTYKKYEEDVCKLLPFAKTQMKREKGEEFFARYIFYVKNYWPSDTGNMEKLITDIIVKRNYIEDDRYIKAFYLEKQKVTDIKDERIVLDIVLYDKRHVLLK